MNLTVFWALAALLCGASLMMGMSLRKQESVSEFFACNANLRFFSLMLTILATQLGGGSIIGTSEAAFQSGGVGIFYSLGISLGLMVMAFSVGPTLRHYGAMTIAQVMGKIYDSKGLHLLASLLSVITLFLILVAIGVSCRKVFVSLGVTSPWGLISFWSVLMGYTVMGGLRAVVVTDTLQVIFILLVFGLITFFLGSNIWVAFQKTDFIQSNGGGISWSSWVLMPLCFMLISQDMGQRCFAAETDQGIKRAMMGASALLLFATVIPVGVGILGRSMGLSLGGESIFMAVMKSTLSPTILSFVAIAVLMAIISTADSLLCAISSNISLDLLNSQNMNHSRMVTFLMGFLALVLSFYEGDVISVMLVGYEISVFGLLVPFLMGLKLKNPRESQAFLSLSLGIIGFGLSKVYTFPGMELCILSGATLPYWKRC